MPDRFHWVIPRKLAAMSLPGRVSPIARDLEIVRREGVYAIASLTERPLDSKAVAAAGLVACHIPIDDFSVPTTDQVREFCAFVDEHLERNEPVAVHCFAGLGRTGTLIACWLVREASANAVRVLDSIRKIEPGFVQTAEQEAFIAVWESNFKSGRT